MSFSDEKSNGFYMPVAPAGSGYGNGGFFGGDWAWILLLLLIGGNGWGFGGGFGGGMMPWLMGGMGGGFGLDYLYPWLNNSEHISDGFRDQQLQTSIGTLQNSVTAGFGDVQNALCAGFAGVNSNICQTGNGIVNALNSGFSGAEIAANGRQMANMQQLFGLQTANLQGFNGVTAGLADLKFTVATENCADRAALNDVGRDLAAQNTANTTALLNTINGGIQAIKDQLCNDKIDAKNEKIAELERQITLANLAASQGAQTATIQAGQRALASEVEQYVAPKAVPAYIVQNPNCCTQNYGCGCNL